MYSDYDYYKDKLIQMMRDVDGLVYKCVTDCGWVGTLEGLEQDPTDGSYSCPQCQGVLVNYTDQFISPPYREELYRIGTY